MSHYNITYLEEVKPASNQMVSSLDLPLLSFHLKVIAISGFKLPETAKHSWRETEVLIMMALSICVCVCACVIHYGLEDHALDL